MTKAAEFRVFEELNDFLPPEHRKTWFRYEFSGSPSIKDAVEAVGVPHTEIDLILINGVSVDFSCRLNDGDRVSVYPVFESIDIGDVTRLRGKPLRDPRFILDVHLGKLARYLRLTGFDTLYDNAYDDAEIVAVSIRERRAILTRDIGILKNGAVTHGYWVRSKEAQKQLAEVIRRFDLASSIRPFTRCLVCNGLIGPVEKRDIEHLLEARTIEYFDTFYRCGVCGKIYWRGSHFESMERFVERIKREMTS